VFRVPQAGQAIGQCAQALGEKMIKLDDSGLMPALKIFGCTPAAQTAACPITSCHRCCCSFVLLLLPNLRLSTL